MTSENPAGKGGAPKGSAKNQRQSRSRDRFERVCVAARAALAKASPIASRFELRVLNAVVSQIALYSRMSDDVAVAQLAAIAYGIPADSVQGFQRDRTATALRSLATKGVITYVPGSGRKALATIGLPIETLHEPCGESHETPVDSVAETPVDSVAKPCMTPGHTEKTSEEASEKRESALLEKLCKRNQRVDRFEWEALLARHHARGLSNETLDQVVTLCLERGEVWPSKYDAELNRCAVRSSIFDDINTWAVNRGPRPKDDCPKCRGKGWFWREGERTEYVDCGCAQAEAVAS